MVEVPPTDEEPHEDAAAMLCERCAGLPGARRLPHPGELRFLETSVWSEVEPVQILAVRLTRRLADEGVGWARDVLDGLWLPEEIQERLDA